MFFRIVLFIWEFVLDVAAVSRLTEGEKDTVLKVKPQQQSNRAEGQKMYQNRAL
jgi:hypothetical protein